MEMIYKIGTLVYEMNEIKVIILICNNRKFSVE